MNQFFSIRRFSMLFKKHTVENYKTYLMSAGVLAGMLLLFLGVSSYANGGYLSPGSQQGIFVVFLLLAGSIFSSMIFAELGDKKKAIPALTLPASHFEKYAVAWLYSFVLFQLLFIGLFYLIGAIVINLGQNSPGRENVLLDLFSEERKTYIALIIYPILHAIIFFGAIYFEKLHFIKTAFAFFIGVFLLGLINKPIISAMIDKKTPGTTIFSPVSVTEGDRAWTIYAADTTNYQLSIVTGLVVIMLWISAYYKLKEKEV